MTEATALRISQSLIRDWNTCKYRYELVHVERLMRKRPLRPPHVGTLVHAGIEAALRAHHEGKDELYLTTVIEKAVASLTEEVKGKFDEPDEQWLILANEQMKEATTIAKRTADYLKLGTDECEWETVCLEDGTPLIEHEMIAGPFSIMGSETKYTIGGRIDWVAFNKKDKGIYLLDFKTRAQIMNDEFDSRQTQASFYVWLLETLHNVTVHQTATLQIRRKVPEQPKRNKTTKKGESTPAMSRAACSTDWETYEAALLAEGLDPMDYLDMKEKLRPFFRFTSEVVNSHQIETLIDDAHEIADEIVKWKRSYYRARTPMNCKDCDMESLCSANLYGHDDDFIRETEYTNRDNPQWLVVDFTEEEES